MPHPLGEHEVRVATGGPPRGVDPGGVREEEVARAGREDRRWQLPARPVGVHRGDERVAQVGPPCIGPREALLLPAPAQVGVTPFVDAIGVALPCQVSEGGQPHQPERQRQVLAGRTPLPDPLQHTEGEVGAGGDATEQHARPALAHPGLVGGQAVLDGHREARLGRERVLDRDDRAPEPGREPQPGPVTRRPPAEAAPVHPQHPRPLSSHCPTAMQTRQHQVTADIARDLDPQGSAIRLKSGKAGVSTLRPQPAGDPGRERPPVHAVVRLARRGHGHRAHRRREPRLHRCSRPLIRVSTQWLTSPHRASSHSATASPSVGTSSLR